MDLPQAEQSGGPAGEWCPHESWSQLLPAPQAGSPGHTAHPSALTGYKSPSLKSCAMSGFRDDGVCARQAETGYNAVPGTTFRGSEGQG